MNNINNNLNSISNSLESINHDVNAQLVYTAQRLLDALRGDLKTRASINNNNYVGETANRYQGMLRGMLTMVEATGTGSLEVTDVARRCRRIARHFGWSDNPQLELDNAQAMLNKLNY